MLTNFDLFNPSDEHRMLRKSVRDFVKKEVEPEAGKRDKEEYFDLKLFRKLGDLGLLGITVPEQFGGSAMDTTAAVIAHEELAYSDPGLTLAYLAHAMLCVNNIAVNASNEQKSRLLPKLCSGEWIGAMAMSEPEIGTDVLGMKTVAQESGDDFIINGKKMWITNGIIDNEKHQTADCVFVYAKTGEHKGRAMISSFIVEQGTAGFFAGQKIEGKTGMRASCTAELVFENCRVPRKNLVGKVGDSMNHMMRNLQIERLTLAAISLGIGRRSLDIMQRYAAERMAFSKPLYHFGQIQRHLAESYAELSACRSYVYNTARTMNLESSGQRLDSDGAKLVSSTMGKRVADRAMQVLGGYGYVSEYVVERLWRDAKLLEIGGGTQEAHQKNIANDLVRRESSSELY